MPSPKLYSAEQFYQTRSYAMGGVEADAFSHDGKALLVSSDETGTFNAYWLPVAGGPVVPLTRSTTNATYGVSAFPRDGRVIVSSDTGGNELTHLYVRGTDGALTIQVVTSVNGSAPRWQQLFERMFREQQLPALNIAIHDFGATPGVVRLRLEQGLEELSHD